MDALIFYAIGALFVIAALTPSALVIIYRFQDVPLRRTEIKNVLDAALCAPSEAIRKEAREALDNNPYVSDPEKTFDRCHRGSRYAFPLVVLTALTTCSAYICYSWVHSKLVSSASALTVSAPSRAVQSSTPLAALYPPDPSTPSSSIVPSTLAAFVPKPPEPSAAPGPLSERLPRVVIMALAGGFVWSLYQIVNRIGAGELGPSDLYEIDLGLLAAVPVGYAFALITAELDGVRSFMAFAASAFPLRDVSSMARQYATRKLLESANTSTSRPAERHLGTAIEGLSDETLARLSELRIATVLDMAYSDPIKVMVQTGFAIPLIIDWMDQSIWALYAGDLKAEMNRHGIRCSLDVCEFVDMHLLDGERKRRAPLDGPNKDALDALAGKMGVQGILLQDLFFRIYADPQVVVLRNLWYPRGVPKELQAQ